jgi:hypothetical protein
MPEITLESLAARVAALERAVGIADQPLNGRPITDPAATAGVPTPADAAPEAVPVRPGSFLAKWVGAIRSDVPNWSADHDRHLGEAQARVMRGEEDDGVR